MSKPDDNGVRPVHIMAVVLTTNGTYHQVNVNEKLLMLTCLNKHGRLEILDRELKGIEIEGHQEKFLKQ